MPFPPPQDHHITLAEASQLTATYRETHKGAIKASLFPSSVYLRLLGQHDCLGIRIYYGQNEKGELCPVLCGVDSEGNDMLPGAEAGDTGENELYDLSFPCPTFCGDGNSLNGE
jgi:hypothetical protein